jgi:hypothetical protein
MSAPIPMSAADRANRQSGAILDGWQVAQAAGVALYQHLIPWLDETARQQGDAGAVQRPRWIGLMTAENGMPEEAIPRVMVSCNGTIGAPEYRGDGTVWARWDVSVAALVDVTDLKTAMRLASVYGAAIGACVSVHTAAYLEQVADVTWLGGPTTPLAPSGAITAQRFEVLAGPAFDTSGFLAPAPADPGVPVDDQGDQVVVTQTNLNLSAVAPGDPVGT